MRYLNQNPSEPFTAWTECADLPQEQQPHYGLARAWGMDDALARSYARRAVEELRR